MIIAYVTTRSDSIGGSHIHLMDLYAEAKKRGHEPIIFVGGEGVFTRLLSKKRMKYISLKFLKRQISPFHDIFSFFELNKRIKELKPDIICLHSSKAGIIGRLVASKLNIPVTFTAHGWSFTEGKPYLSRNIYKVIEKLFAKKTSKIISVSNYDRDLALRNLKINSDLIVNIHNGMDDVCKNLMVNYEECDKIQQINLIMVARFDVPKDQPFLIHAMKDLTNFHLFFAGDGPQMSNSEKIVKNLGMSDKVTFLGNVDDIASILAKCHIFVLISNYEGFPLSTLEAMRAGLPVIVTDVGGAAEAIVDGVTGFKIDKGDEKQLKEKVKLLMESPQIRKKMGQAGRIRYENYFSSNIMYDQTFSVYNEIING